MLNSLELSPFAKFKDSIKIVFDIGSRDDVDFLNTKKECEYHLFEPNHASVQSLKEKLKAFDQSKVFVNQYGMSDEIADDLVYYENTQSFLLHPFGLSTHQGSKYSVRTIDWYVKQNNISAIDFLKIDAEGMDYKILLGAKDSLEKNMISYIQFEYWDGVKKFNDLLQEKYNLYFIRSANDFSLLTDDVINEIDNSRIPKGLGGDIIAIHKKVDA